MKMALWPGDVERHDAAGARNGGHDLQRYLPYPFFFITLKPRFE